MQQLTAVRVRVWVSVSSMTKLHGGAQEEQMLGKQLHAARKRKADEFQAFADGVLQDADRCVTLCGEESSGFSSRRCVYPPSQSTDALNTRLSA